MRLGRAWAAAAASLMAACGSEPGTLIIELDFVPEVVTANAVTITGRVQRTPPKNTTIVVTASGGRSAATDTANANGQFSLEVELQLNRSNTIQVTATDADGSTGEPATKTIVQDNEPPVVSSSTPADRMDGAPTTGDVVLTFSEAIKFEAGAAVRLVTARETIPGTAVLSMDARSLTFTPQRNRRTNSVYEIHLLGITDLAGNEVTEGAAACFVTSPGTPSRTLADSTNDLFFAGNTTGGSGSDVTRIRFGVWDTFLTAVFVFTTPRVIDSTKVNNLLAYIELDLDQDSTTGVLSFKDSLFFASNLNRGSGTRVEYLIAIEPQTFGSGYVGEYGANALDITAVEVFRPAFCDRFAGVAASFASLNGDDGNFNYVAHTWNVTPQGGFFLDPAPEAGHDSVRFAGLFAPPARPSIRAPAAERPSEATLRLRALLSRIRPPR